MNKYSEKAKSCRIGKIGFFLKKGFLEVPLINREGKIIFSQFGYSADMEVTLDEVISKNL